MKLKHRLAGMLRFKKSFGRSFAFHPGVAAKKTRN